MSVQSLPQQKNEMITVAVEQGDKEELKATLIPVTCESEKEVSGYPVTPPVAGQLAQTEQQEPLLCGCGLMWTIFFIGFFFGGVFLWWIGVYIGIYVFRQDKRERPGFIANLIAAILGTVILIIFIFHVLQTHEQIDSQCDTTYNFEDDYLSRETVCS